VSPSTLFLAFWFFLLLILFGLARLLLSRRGTDEDWQALVAFGKKYPADRHGTSERWGELRSNAPPGLHLEDAAEPLTMEALYERVRTHQAILQGEMKWAAHHLTNPFHWLVAGVRGFMLLFYGAPVDWDAAARTRRRAAEADANFDRVASALVGVVVFALAVTVFFAAQAGLELYRQQFR
jgi:hypothetical protein